MAETAIYWCQPTTTVRRSLRRFSHADEKQKCIGPLGYHDARVPLDEVEHPVSAPCSGPTIPLDDPRWPAACPCGYRFRSSDPWQVFEDRVYERPDTLQRFTLREAEPGAIIDAEWKHDEHGTAAGHDGLCLVVKLPDGTLWGVDDVPRLEGAWTRTGEPPKITSTRPARGRTWTGWIHEGLLVDA